MGVGVGGVVKLLFGDEGQGGVEGEGWWVWGADGQCNGVVDVGVEGVELPVLLGVGKGGCEGGVDVVLGVELEGEVGQGESQALAAGFDVGFFEGPDEEEVGAKVFRVIGFEVEEVGLFGGGEEVFGDVLCVAAAGGGFDVDADVVGVGDGEDDEVLGVGEVEAEWVWGGRLDEFGAASFAGGELPVCRVAGQVAGEDCADEGAGYKVAVAVSVA